MNENITSENIFEKGMLISLTMGGFDGRMKLSEEQLKDFPTEIVRGVHDIFEKEFKNLLKEINSHDLYTRTKIGEMSIPFPIHGIYFMLSKQIEKTLEFLKIQESERNALIQNATDNYDNGIVKFAEQYPEYYRHAKGKYPTKTQFKERFYLRYQIFTITQPEKALSLISPDIYLNELNKFKTDVSTMKQDVVNIIYTELIDRIKTLQKQCTDGKPSQKTFNKMNKILAQIDEVYSDFVDRQDIKDMIAKIKTLVTGVTADDIRSSEEFKKEFKNSMAKAFEEIKNLPDAELTRSLDF